MRDRRGCASNAENHPRRVALWERLEVAGRLEHQRLESGVLRLGVLRSGLLANGIPDDEPVPSANGSSLSTNATQSIRGNRTGAFCDGATTSGVGLRTLTNRRGSLTRRSAEGSASVPTSVN